MNGQTRYKPDGRTRYAAVRVRLLILSHHDAAYAHRLLDRLERIGIRTKAQGLTELVASLRRSLRERSVSHPGLTRLQEVVS